MALTALLLSHSLIYTRKGMKALIDSMYVCGGVDACMHIYVYSEKDSERDR